MIVGLFILLGIVLMCIAIYGAHYIITIIISGIFAANWFMILGGSLLFLITIAFIVGIFVIGLWIVLVGFDNL